MAPQNLFSKHDERHAVKRQIETRCTLWVLEIYPFVSWQTLPICYKYKVDILHHCRLNVLGLTKCFFIVVCVCVSLVCVEGGRGGGCRNDQCTNVDYRHLSCYRDIAFFFFSFSNQFCPKKILAGKFLPHVNMPPRRSFYYIAF